MDCPALTNQNTIQLLDDLGSLSSLEERTMFFRDLLTEKELVEMGKRWKAVKMLDEGVPYTSIAAEVGLSSATIARISQWVQTGAGGYALLLSKLHHHQEANHSRE